VEKKAGEMQKQGPFMYGDKFGRTRIKRELWVILTSGVIVQ
jgi:hypothetical protein